MRLPNPFFGMSASQEGFSFSQRPIARLAGQTLIYGLTTVVGRFLNYLLVILHTRIFHNADYGTISLLYAYASFVAILFTVGMETAFFRHFNKDNNKEGVYATALASLLASSAFFSVLLIVLSGPLAVVLSIPKHPEYIVWFALILGADAVTAIPFARLRQENRAFRYAAIRLANIGFNVGFNLFFLLLCPWLYKVLRTPAASKWLAAVYNPHIGVGYVFIANLIASAATLLMLLPEILGRRLRIDRKIWASMIPYALPLIIVGLAGMVNETMDRIFLRLWLPGTLQARLANIGIYSACYKLSLVMTLFIQAFRLTAEPFFFEQAKTSDARKTYARVMTYFALVCSLIFLGVMVFIDLFQLLIGPEFRSGMGIVPILLMANLCLGVYYSISVWYKLTDKTLYGALISLGGALLTLLLNFWWIPLMGFRGSAWATLSCYFAMMTAGYLLGQRHYHIPYDLKRFFFYPGLALGFFFLNNHLLSRAIHLSLAGRMVSGALWVSLFLLISFYFERRRDRPSA